MSTPKPPRLAESLLARMLRTPDGDHILGDLAEEYAARHREGTRVRAMIWYWGQVGRSVTPLLRRAFHGTGNGGAGFDPRRSPRPLRSAAFAPGYLLQETRHSVRTLVRRPIFPVLVVLTLGLGIGVATTTFAMVRGVLLRPLPLPDGDRLVFIRHLRLKTGQADGGVGPGTFVRYRDGSRLLDDLVAFTVEGATLTDGTPSSIRIAYPTPGLGDVVGLPPVAGRWNSEEDLTTERWVAVLSYALWMRRYGGDRQVVGTTIHLDGLPVEVIGVAPPQAALLQGDADLWVPLRRPIDERGFGGFGWRAVGRLREGATVEQLRAELGTLLATLPEALPRYAQAWHNWYETFGVRPAPFLLLDERVRSVRRWIWLLMGAAAAVFLVGLANVATLALARSLDRDTDVAVRAAMGGGRDGLTRLFAVEAALLAGFSCLVGLGVTALLVQGLPLAAGGIIPRLEDVSLDPTVLGGALLLTLLSTGILVLIPSVRLPRDLASTLRGATQGRTRGFRSIQGGLLVAQIALAAALVVFGGLMARSFWALRTLDLGFPTKDLYTVHIKFPTRSDGDPEKRAFFRQLQERLEAIPDVSSASASECVPLRCSSGANAVVQIDDRWIEDDEVQPLIRTSRFLPGYFNTLGIPVTKGRDVTWTDAWDPSFEGEPFGVVEKEGTWVQYVVLNQRAAGDIFPGMDPSGHYFRVGFNGARTVVAGVVPDVVVEGLSMGTVPIDLVRYLPDPRFDGMTWVVRSSLEPEALLSALRAVVWDMDRNAPVENLADYRTLIAEGTRDRTLIMLLALIGAGLSVLLGLVGVYGALAHEVRRRQRELGIRNALGADAAELRMTVLRRAGVLVTVGLTLGLGLSAVASRALANVVYGVSALDPETYFIAGLIMAGLGLLAAYVPAVRASRTDPVHVLRTE